MNIFEKLNGEGRIGTPRTHDELDTTLCLAGNTPNRYKRIDTPEGEALYNDVRALESRLIPLRYREMPPDTPLPAEAQKDAEDLLYKLDLLRRLSVGWVLRSVGLRTHRKVEELVPDVVQSPQKTFLETEPA